MASNLKKLLESLLTEEEVGMGEDYEFKEAVMKEIQRRIKKNIDNVDRRGRYLELLDTVIESTREEFERGVDMARKSLKDVPYEAFKEK